MQTDDQPDFGPDWTYENQTYEADCPHHYVVAWLGCAWQAYKNAARKSPTGLKGNLRLNLTCSERLMLVLLHHYTSEYTVCCLLYLISPT